jgi:hypothetical protein
MSITEQARQAAYEATKEQRDHYDAMITRAREDIKSFMGKPLDEVQNEVESAGGWDFRITQIDKNPMIITCDVKMNRVNVRVVDGLVTEAWLG